MAERTSPPTPSTSLPSSTSAAPAPPTAANSSPPSLPPATLPPTAAPTTALPTPTPPPTSSTTSSTSTILAPPSLTSSGSSEDVTGTGMLGLAGSGTGTAKGLPTTTLATGANLTSKTPSAPSITIRKANRPGVPQPTYSAAPPSSSAPPSAPPSQSQSQSQPPQQPQQPNGAPSPSVPAYPSLHLTPLNDTFVPKQISLSPVGSRVKVGRQTNAKTIPNASNGYFDSKVLSRMHAEVWSEDGKVLIKDVKSSNGTFINGTRLSPEAAESDVFELHTDDVVEFGIDIVSDDNKTIVHHKVAAKVYLVMNAEDVAQSQRELQHWYRAASEAPLQRRGAAKQVPQGSNGVTFEHVLSRLQGELNKSRDTGTHLGDLTSTLNEVHDTLGGGAPPPLPSFPPPSRAPPYGALNGNPSNGVTKDAHAQSIAALQSQLNETQNSLAGHVGKIRDLEGLLAEHEVIKHEVGGLRKQMEDAQRDMEVMMRGRGESVRNGGADGRESPIAALLEAQEAADEGSDDGDDTRSISSTDTVRINTADQLASVHGSTSRQNGIIPMVNGVLSTSTSTTSNDSAREKQLQEQNAKLSARLESLSAELEEATKLGQNLRTQHAEASSTIRALEERIQGLEKAVEGRVAEVEGKVLQEVEQRWKGWKDAFEESWKKERESWESERTKLTAVVREWEERKKSTAGSSSDESSDVEDSPEDGTATKGVAGTTTLTGSKGKRPRSRRRRRSTASRVSVLAAGTDGQGVASDSDDTIGDSSPGPASGAWSGPQRGVPVGGSPGFDRSHGGTQALPYASAGAVVLIGVAAAWALSVKLKE